MLRRGVSLFSRRPFQLYLLVLVGLLCYLHYSRYSSVTKVESTSRSSGRDLFSQPQEGLLQHSGAAHKRFIVSLNYWEQFTMATGNLLSLVCLGSKWNATIVQPYTFNSRLYGLRNFKPDDNFKRSDSAHSLDIIYDINSLNDLLLKHKLLELATFEAFVKNASRSITVVHYISAKETHELAVMKGETKSRIEQDFRKNSVIDCKHHLSNYKEMIERALSTELQSSPQDRFHIHKYWCVNMSALSTPRRSAAEMEFGSGDATIFIVNWRGLGKGKLVRNSAKGLHTNNRIAMFNGCRHHLGITWQNLVAYSPQVEQTARDFAASLGLSPAEKFVAVHIRSEKLGLREPRLPGVTTACFQELLRQKEKIVQEHPSLRVVYLADYSPYSSDTCKRCKGSKDIKLLLWARNIQTTYFDPAHLNATVVDSGFAAAVESHFLASSSFLLLCGGGGYQNQVAARFERLKFKTHSTDRDKEFFRVCAEDKEILRLINNSSPTLG